MADFVRKFFVRRFAGTGEQSSFSGSALLLENGSFFLLENDGYLLLE